MHTINTLLTAPKTPGNNDNLLHASPGLKLVEQVLRSADSTITEYFAHWIIERHSVYLKRLAEEPSPWTDDRIIASYRFCNVFRCADRVSQAAIRVANSDDSLKSFRHQFFRSLIFRFFNREDTWAYLRKALGSEPSLDNFDPTLYGQLITNYRKAGKSAYGIAYRTTPPIRPGGVVYVDRFGGRNHGITNTHIMQFDLMDRWLNADSVPERILENKRLEDSYRLLSAYSCVGPFLAMQWSIDLGYGPWLPSDWESQFVVPGPGAGKVYD